MISKQFKQNRFNNPDDPFKMQKNINIQSNKSTFMGFDALTQTYGDQDDKNMLR